MSPRGERARWPFRLLLILGGTLLGLLAAEILVRAFVPLQDVGPPLTEYDPALGVRLKRSFRCVRETPEFRMRFSSNSRGWRGPELAGEKAEILFLGDSFTMGYGVDDGLEFPQILGRELAVPVANLGLGGTAPDRWPRILQGEARSLDPRIVVLQLCHTDVKDLARGSLASLDGEGRLVQRDPPPLPAGRRLQGILEVFPWIADSHLLGLLRQVRGRKARPVSPGVEVTGDYALARALLAESIRTCSDRDWKVIVLAADMNDSEADPFAVTCAEAGVPFLRMPSKIEAPGLYFEVDGHWTEAGHRRAAELLEPWLR